MIKVNFIGRLGNNMIQYSIAKFISDIKKQKLCYSITGNTSCDLMFNIFPKTQIQNNESFTNNNTKIFGYDSTDNQIKNFNMQDLLDHDGDIL